MQLLQRGLNDAGTQAAVNSGVLTSQAYQMDQDSRKQAITEQLAQRQIPLNEITALMSGSQVSNPFSTPGFAQNAQVGARPSLRRSSCQGSGTVTMPMPRPNRPGTCRKGSFSWARPGSARGVEPEAARAAPE